MQIQNTSRYNNGSTEDCALDRRKRSIWVVINQSLSPSHHIATCVSRANRLVGLTNVSEQVKVERRHGPVVGRSLWTRPARVQSPGWDIIRCKNLALYIRDCESLCLSDETLKAVGPFYLVSMPGEVKYPTQGVNV